MRDKSLQDLDGEDWGEPTYDSYVVRTCHALRRKPIDSLTDEELRLAIGQNIGLQWLMPIAVERLEETPHRSGDFYDGDLLQNVLRSPQEFWSAHPSLRQRVNRVAQRFFAYIEGQDQKFADPRFETIGEAYIQFADPFRRDI